jgi:hypothetical protein
MTKQFDDRFIYQGEPYVLGFLSHIFIGIRQFGLTPTPCSTACWRGYVATFTLDSENRLLLKNVLTNNGNGRSQILPINGIQPKIIKPAGLVAGHEGFRYLEYNEIGLPIEYSGTVEIEPITGENQWRSLDEFGVIGNVRRRVRRILSFFRKSVREEERIQRLYLDHPPRDRDKAVVLAFSNGILQSSRMSVPEEVYQLKHTPDDLKTVELCHAAVQQVGWALRFVPEELKTPELCLVAVQSDGFALELVPDGLKTVEFFHAAVQQDGWALRLVPEELKISELCLAAVQRDGRALEHVPEKLKTLEICLAALRQSGLALQLVPDALKTVELYHAAVRSCGSALEYVPRNIKFVTPEICLTAIQGCGAALQFVPNKLRTAELCLAAVQNDGLALQFVPDEHKTPELCLAAAQNSADASLSPKGPIT